MADTYRALLEAAEAWHAPNCTVDAAGACLADADLKEAWIAGYLAASPGIARALAEYAQSGFHDHGSCDCV